MPLPLRRTLFVWLKRLFLLGFSLIWYFTISSVSLAEELPTPVNADLADMEQPTPGRSALDASAISSEKVSQFVKAYLEVVNLIEQRESELQGAETESESIQVQQEIQARALELIEAEGLTLQEYLQLLGLANIDPEFGERVAAQLQEASE